MRWPFFLLRAHKLAVAKKMPHKALSLDCGAFRLCMITVLSKAKKCALCCTRMKPAAAAGETDLTGRSSRLKGGEAARMAVTRWARGGSS